MCFSLILPFFFFLNQMSSKHLQPKGRPLCGLGSGWLGEIRLLGVLCVVRKGPPWRGLTWRRFTPPAGISAGRHGAQNTLLSLSIDPCPPGHPGVTEPGPLTPPAGQSPVTPQPRSTWNRGMKGKVKKCGLRGENFLTDQGAACSLWGENERAHGGQVPETQQGLSACRSPVTPSMASAS